MVPLLTGEWVENMESPTKTGGTDPRKRRRWSIVLIILGVLIVARVILPYVLLHFSNKRLASMPNYYGHIADIDLALIRGAYRIDAFYLDKLDSVSKERTPFMLSLIHI